MCHLHMKPTDSTPSGRILEESCRRHPCNMPPFRSVLHFSQFCLGTVNQTRCAAGFRQRGMAMWLNYCRCLGQSCLASAGSFAPACSYIGQSTVAGVHACQADTLPLILLTLNPKLQVTSNAERQMCIVQGKRNSLQASSCLSSGWQPAYRPVVIWAKESTKLSRSYGRSWFGRAVRH